MDNNNKLVYYNILISTNWDIFKELYNLTNFFWDFVACIENCTVIRLCATLLKIFSGIKSMVIKYKRFVT